MEEKIFWHGNLLGIKKHKENRRLSKLKRVEEIIYKSTGKALRLINEQMKNNR